MSITLTNTQRASLAYDGSEGMDFSAGPSISGNGSLVAFESWANNLVADDFNGHGDIFVRDLDGGTISRITMSFDGFETDGSSYNPFFSANGSMVGFESFASNLVSDDFNGYNDVFVHDMTGGTTERVSVSWDGSSTFGDSYNPTLSNDGHLVAFESWADNLVSDDFNGMGDVFVRDVMSNVTTRVSVGFGGQMVNGQSFDPMISGNGGYVVFQSSADNLVSDDFNGWDDIFVRDLATSTTERVNMGFDGTEAMGNSFAPAISSDGRWVAFASDAPNLTSDDFNGMQDVFLHDRDTGSTIRLTNLGGSASIGEVGLSPDGRFVSFTVFDPGQPVDPQTRVYDTETGMTQTLNDIGFAGELSFTSDSTMVAFQSDASNLVGDDFNGMTDVFVSDTGVVPPVEEPTGLFTDGDDEVDLNGHTVTEDNIAETFFALGGADTVTLPEHGFLNAPFFGGDGNDMIIGSRAANFISGDAGNDTLVGDDGDDGLMGGMGTDLVYGGEGDDMLSGGSGADRLFGDAGMDMLDGGSGNDQLTGGMGADQFWMSGDMAGHDIIRDFTSGEDMIMLDHVLDGMGNMVTGFAQLDTDTNGMLDVGDQFVMASETGIVLTLTGGSLAIEGDVAQAGDFVIS